MDFGIRGKKAIVLAASKGMGRAIARALALEGCELALCAREEAALAEAVAAIEKESGVKVFSQTCDVTSEAGRQVFLTAALKQLGGIDILINNCGGPKSGALMEVQDLKDWQQAFERSLLQVVRWTQAVVPHMKGWGRIVNIVSTSVKQPIDGLLLSNSIRPGVLGFTKSVSRELMGKGITINSVLPGWIRTDRAIELAKIRAEKEKIPMERVIAERAAEIPAARLGEPDEVGTLVAFLCSQQASYITGTDIRIDGGVTRGI